MSGPLAYYGLCHDCCQHLRYKLPDPSLLTGCHKPISPIIIQMADGTALEATLIGNVSTATSSGLLCIFPVLLVPAFPSLYYILLSKIHSPRSRLGPAGGRRSGRLYYVKLLYLPNFAKLDVPTFHASPSKFNLWHSRLGHLSFQRLRNLISTGDWVI